MGNDNSRKLSIDSSSKTVDTMQKIPNSGNLTSKEFEADSVARDLAQARKSIDEKNKTIDDLRREIDKLKSVLDQTHSNISDQENESICDVSLRSKRLGVSGESPCKEVKRDLVRSPKSAEIKKVIRHALMHNMILSKLDPGQINEIIECMYERNILENCYVIKEGEEGHHLYVALNGQFEIYKEEKLISRMGSGKCFGELALLYNCKRTASVKAMNTATLWVLERSIFQSIMMRTSSARRQDLKVFLESIPLFSNLLEVKLMQIVEMVEQQSYSDGQCIIRQGEPADSFFIIQSGWVKVTQKINSKEVDVREMTTGDYFGEKALLEERKRTASVYATKGDTEVLCLYRQGFTELIGEFSKINSKEYNDEIREHVYSLQINATEESPPSLSSSRIMFEDLEILSTIGVGGFGRVELVVNKKDTAQSYALKCMKKQYIVHTKQQEHVISERNILHECRSDFICRLYASFRDAKYVYLLTEVCLGGELWSFLRDKIHFDNPTTIFCLACVLEALQYLHYRGIIYRDLKPENMLIGNSGYLKLCDFGFAKKIGFGKRTWTFCGTPEYVAPEIILNKGHDFSADYWSIGILTFELLNGSPPFLADDAMKIYNMTLRGVEACNILHNRRISAKAVCFIKRMCRFIPIERLGTGINGIDDIRAHRYFQGFDWDGIKSLSMKSPFNPKVTSSRDASNFDKFVKDPEIPPDELSGWDRNF